MTETITGTDEARLYLSSVKLLGVFAEAQEDVLYNTLNSLLGALQMGAPVSHVSHHVEALVRYYFARSRTRQEDARLFESAETLRVETLEVNMLAGKRVSLRFR